LVRASRPPRASGAGALSPGLGHTFKIMKPVLKYPWFEHWECFFRIFDQLL
jgi:hypothetical protein